MKELNEAEKAFVKDATNNNIKEFSFAGMATIMAVAELLQVAPDHVYSIYKEKREGINKFLFKQG